MDKPNAQTIHTVSVAGHSPRYFATREAAEAYLRDEIGAAHHERAGWLTVDEDGEVETLYDIREEGLRSEIYH